MTPYRSYKVSFVIVLLYTLCHIGSYGCAICSHTQLDTTGIAAGEGARKRIPFPFNHNCEARGSFSDANRLKALNPELHDTVNNDGEGGDGPMNEYIIAFKQYADVTNHTVTFSQLARYTSSSDAHLPPWCHVPRHNKASQFPTDFIVIRFHHDSDKGEVKLLLDELVERHPSSVKYAVPHRSFHGSLSSTTPSSDDTARNDEHKTRPKRKQTLHHGTLSVEEGMFVQHGKFTTSFAKPRDSFFANLAHHSRHLLSNNKFRQITKVMKAAQVWDDGFTGKGIKVAVFDTGVRRNHPHLKNIMERTNWTDEHTLDDRLGHGSFVAGVIASHKECKGFAPDAEIYTFRVFNTRQLAYTSWFLDGFNYAIHTKVHVLNLSIGGPDFRDEPFVDKVREMTSNGIIVVSAIGNDGPLFGTLNNPADMPDVLGVGGIDWSGRVAAFASRGMSLWEAPHGYGRVKPDVVTYGESVWGSGRSQGCKAFTGSSVASPVAAGVVTLLASTVPEKKRWRILNPASMKQIIIAGAKPHSSNFIYEQGAGRVDVGASYKYLKTYKPHASAFPSALNMTQCPYFWPFCEQPLFHSQFPTIVNVTILNGMGVTGKIVEQPQWLPDKPADGEILAIDFTHSEVLWPWTGYLGVHMQVTAKGASYVGKVTGKIKVKVSSPQMHDYHLPHLESEIVIPVVVQVVPTPNRRRRILWDTFHHLGYPSGYFPRDHLGHRDFLDWNGDHPHTNFRDLFARLRNNGYFVELLRSDYTCFDASAIGTLMIVDTEDEFFPDEITKLRSDVMKKGLSVVVLAEWYNADVMRKVRFKDDNTRMIWTPATGGANIPALNDLLAPYKIALGDRIYSGTVSLPGGKPSKFSYLSGTSLAKFPFDGHVVVFDGVTDHTKSGTHVNSGPRVSVPLLGLLQLTANEEMDGVRPGSAGRIAVFGDSSCVDSKLLVVGRGRSSAKPCYDLVLHMLSFAMTGERPVEITQRDQPKLKFDTQAKEPLRWDANGQMKKYSRVLGHITGASCLVGRQPVPWRVPQSDLHLGDNHVADKENIDPNRATTANTNTDTPLAQESESTAPHATTATPTAEVTEQPSTQQEATPTQRSSVSDTKVKASTTSKPVPVMTDPMKAHAERVAKGKPYDYHPSTEFVEPKEDSILSHVVNVNGLQPQWWLLLLPLALLCLLFGYVTGLCRTRSPGRGPLFQRRRNNQQNRLKRRPSIN